MSALLALAAAIGWGSSDFAAGTASRKSSAVSVVILTHFAAVIALLCVALDFGPVFAMLDDIFQRYGPSAGTVSIDWAAPAISGSPRMADIGWGLAAGLGGGAGAMLLFRGLGRGSMAVVAPITATGAAAIPVLFGIATGDPVTAIGIVGIALALIAIVLVSLSGGDDEPLTVPAEWSAAPPFDPPSSGPPSFDPPSFDPPSFDPPSSGPPSSDPGSMPAPRAQLAAVGVISVAAPYDDLATDTSPGASPGPLPPPAIEMQRPRVVVCDDEIRLPLRAVREAVLVLVLAAVLSSAAIASRAMRSLLDGAAVTGGDAVAIGFALLILALAAFALNSVKPLFDVSQLRTRQVASSPAPSHGEVLSPSGAVSWRAIVRQPGVTEALFSGLGFGLFFVFIYRASEAAGHWPLVSARLVSVVMFVLIALATTTAVLPERDSRGPVVLAGVLDASAAVFFVMSTRVGLLSVGAVLAALYPVVTVVLARVITKERIRRRQLTGLVLALVAVGLLAM